MVEQSSQLVQKLWNYCNILRDDLSAPDCEPRSGRCAHAQAGGLSYRLARGLSVLAAQADAQASGDAIMVRHGSAQAEQLTFLLFVKMADEQSRPPFNKPSPIPEGVDLTALHRIADVRQAGKMVV